MKLMDQVAAITGAGRNIGEEVAKILAKEGAIIAVIDIDRGRCSKVVSDIVSAGGRAAPFICDVSKEADIKSTVNAISDQFGRFDMMINNAAISDNKSILEVTSEEWSLVLSITLTAPFLFSKYAAEAMIAAGNGGRIVNVTSTSGYYGRKRAVAYASAKGGLTSLSRSMAVQLAPYGIRVNSVVPNKIGSPVGKDEFDPNRPVVNLRDRPGIPLDLARAIKFLVSDEADFIVGVELFVDGGVSALMPGE